jgi:glycosyltransferase involved in cell wall biosynthesis
MSSQSESSQSQQARSPVTFLVFDAFSGGGVSRTTATLANRLSRTRPVHVISLYRRRPVARFPLDPAVQVTVLRDLTRPEPAAHRLLDRLPSRLRPAPSDRSMSLLTDLLLRRALGAITSGVVVSTRPALHLALTTFARPGVTTIGWDHLNFPARFANPVHREVLRTAVPRLDGYAVLTAADAADYRAAMPDAATAIHVMPNSVSWPLRDQPPPLDSKVIVAAGRLVPRKGFKRMVRAFAPLARRHPDWQLHIYGIGAQRGEIAALVRKLDLESQVMLAGYSNDLPSVLANASVYAMTSLSEGFPLVLIEAFSTGVPVVAFDCPRGPGEIVRDGHNGVLVPEGPHRLFTEGLRRLMEDDELRARLGAQALRDAASYTVETVAERWELLFDELERRQRIQRRSDVRSASAKRRSNSARSSLAVRSSRATMRPSAEVSSSDDSPAAPAAARSSSDLVITES